LDSFSYRNISDDVRKKLEDALSSGQKTKIDDVIEVNPVFKQLSGKSGEDIAKALGIDFSLSENIARGISSAIPSIVEGLNQIDASGPQAAAEALGEMLTNLQGLEGISYSSIADGLAKVDGALKSSSNSTEGSTAGSEKTNTTATFDFSELF